MNTFYFEMTDTFGDDLNYCWLKRFKVKANTLHGALCKLSKEVGLYELDFDHAEYVTENTDWLEKAVEL